MARLGATAPAEQAETPEAHAARERLLAFTTYLNPSYQTAAHHIVIAEALEAVAAGHLRRLVLILPPRHGKSELASVNFPAWYLGRHPDKRIIATSYAALLAYTFSRRARNLFRHPLWPFAAQTAGDLANVQQWGIDGHRGGYFAAGVGGGVTGMGGDILLCDDPVRGHADADSRTYRERAWDWFRADAMTRLTPDGAVILIGTRWHTDDLIGRALSQLGEEDWTVIHLPAISDAGEALWPEVWPLERLEEQRRLGGERNFTALYQGRPAPASGGIFPRHRWRFWCYPGQPLPEVAMPAPGGGLTTCAVRELPPFFDEQLQSWDLTFSDAASNDLVAGQVWASWRADRFLLDQSLGLRDFPATITAVRDLSAKWPRARRILVESSANGPAVVASLRDELPGLAGVTPQGSKVARANAITPEVEAGHVYLPHPAIAPWVEAYVEELATFPSGAHDDQVDATSQALIHLAKRQASVTTVTSYLAPTLEDEDEERRYG